MPAAFVLMKAGFHGEEDLDEIVKRKTMEIRSQGFTFWGYGGSACHPIRQIQPFATRVSQPRVFLSPTVSRPRIAATIATSYSADGRSWLPIGKNIVVTSSRYALVIGELSVECSEVDLASYTIAIGPSAGKAASSYLRGRCDKACLRWRERLDPFLEQAKAPLAIAFSASLKPPYAVLLQNRS